FERRRQHHVQRNEKEDRADEEEGVDADTRGCQPRATRTSAFASSGDAACRRGGVGGEGVHQEGLASVGAEFGTITFITRDSAAPLCCAHPSPAPPPRPR